MVRPPPIDREVWAASEAGTSSTVTVSEARKDRLIMG